MMVYHLPLSFSCGLWPPCSANLLWQIGQRLWNHTTVRVHITKIKQNIRVKSEKKSLYLSPAKALYYELLHNLVNLTYLPQRNSLCSTFEFYRPTLFLFPLVTLDFCISVRGYFQPAGSSLPADTIYNSSSTAAGKLESDTLNHRSYIMTTNTNIYRRNT